MKQAFDNKVNMITALMNLEKAWLDCVRTFEAPNIDCNDYIVKNYPFDKSFTDINVSEWVESSVKSLYKSLGSQRVVNRGNNKNIYAEVRSDFYDEEDKCIVIDAWKTSNPDEEGLAVAKIYDNGNIDYLYPDAKYDKIVQEEIEAVVANLNKYPDKTRSI